MQLSRHRILYIEDHEDTRELVSLVLQQRDFEVTTTGTVAGAVSLAGERKYDLYLLDTRLPDGSGVDLCKRLRSFDAHTPILFYSAAAYEVDRKSALESGAQGYLTKPSTNGALGDLVAQLIADSKLRVPSGELV